MKTKTILWTVIAASFLALSAFAQTNAVNVLAPVVAAPPMDPSLAALLSALGPKFAFLVPLFAKLFALSLVMKVVAPKIQNWASSWISQNVTTPGSDHDIAIRAILSNKVYRFVCVVLDMALSINLPTLSTYLKQLAAANPGVTIEHPDGSVSAAPKVVTQDVAAQVATAAAQPAPATMKLSLLAAVIIFALLLGLAATGHAQTNRLPSVASLEPTPTMPSITGGLGQVGQALGNFLTDAYPYFGTNATLVYDAGVLYNAHHIGGLLAIHVPLRNLSTNGQISIGPALAYMNGAWTSLTVSASAGTTWNLPLLGKVYTDMGSGPDWNFRTQAPGAFSYVAAHKSWDISNGKRLGIVLGAANESTLTGIILLGCISLAY